MTNSSADSNPEPESEPSPQEILVPPFLLLFAGATGILLFWLYSNYCKRTRNGVRTTPVTSENLQKNTWINNQFLEKVLRLKVNKIHDLTIIPNSSMFFTEKEIRKLERFRSFHNSFKELFFISLPAILALGFCPLTLLLHQTFVQFFWPPERYSVTPNINESITCYLAPSGMVYAVSFGFAFQQVLGKQTEVLKKISKDIWQINQLISLTKTLRWISPKTRMKIYITLKAEAFSMMDELMKHTNDDAEKSGVCIWNIVDYLRDVTSPGDVMDSAICSRFVKYISSVHSMNIGSLHSKMHFLQWALLEMLGYFTFLGILMVQAESYKLELTMCILTVVSITMLCYIVADLDNPFHGFFRIDVSVVENLILKLERLYDQTLKEEPEYEMKMSPLSQDKVRKTKVQKDNLTDRHF